MIDHTAPCDKLVNTIERVAKTEEKIRSDHSWIENIHKDHECTKKELVAMKIKLSVLVAVATIIGNLLYKLIDVLWPFAKAAIKLLPSAYAGN